MFSGLGEARTAAEEALDELRERDAARKLYARDGSLWSDDPETAAEVERLVPSLGEDGEYALAELHPAVVEGDRDSHG